MWLWKDNLLFFTHEIHIKELYAKVKMWILRGLSETIENEYKKARLLCYSTA